MRSSALSFLAFVASLHTFPTFASSTIRNPLSAISEVRNASIHTTNGRVNALSHFDLSFVTFDETRIKFSLGPNHDILGEDTTVTYLSEDGVESRRETVDRLSHKVYKGEAWMWRTYDGWNRVGWARIVLYSDGKIPSFEGGFSVAHDNYHIQSAANFEQTRHLLDPEITSVREGEPHMVVWRNSDVLPAISSALHSDLRRDLDEGVQTSCSADDLLFNVPPEHPVRKQLNNRLTGTFRFMDLPQFFGKRQIDNTTSGYSGGGSLVNSIGLTAGCPTTRKVALVGIATDCTYTAQFNSTDAVKQNIFGLVNTASAVYENTFNISLGLQNLTISLANCPGTPATATEWNQECSDSVDIGARLNYFSAWRGARPDNNAYWTLLSTCNTGAEIGLAWPGQACQNQATKFNDSTAGNDPTSSGSQTVSGANFVVRTRGAAEWQVFAHETGHTFGAVHDCYSGTCPQTGDPNQDRCCPLSRNTCDANQQYIMNPSANNGINKFSQCSIGNICSAMGSKAVKADCLSDNRGVTTYSGQTCGNGIVEPGEDCDCGGSENCGSNPCCDPSTCKFKNNAVCDDSNEDCCRNCQFATNGTVCRTSTGACDLQETCPGNSAICPADVYAPDGDSCGNGLQCASGQCTSRDQQCQNAMAGYSRSNNTSACDSSSCVITCQSPDFPSNTCYGPQQNFLDGTVCGGSGKCSSGVCRGGSFSSDAKQWIRDHKDIVIGVGSAVGGLILLAILGCIIQSCCGRGRAGKNVARPQPPYMSQTSNWYPQGQAMQQPNQGWFANSNGSRGGWDEPPVPPPAYPGPRARYA